MKKTLTLAALCIMVMGAQAQSVISLAGLNPTDFTYDSERDTVGTWTETVDGAQTSVTAPAFTYVGNGKYCRCIRRPHKAGGHLSRRCCMDAEQA